MRFGEKNLYGKLVYLFNGSLQLGRSWFCTGFALYHADDVETEFFGEIREGLMKGHDFFIRHIVKGSVHFRFKSFELCDVGIGIFLIGIGMFRVRSFQLFSDVFRLYDSVCDAEPDMGIFLTIFFQKFLFA